MSKINKHVTSAYISGIQGFVQDIINICENTKKEDNHYLILNENEESSIECVVESLHHFSEKLLSLVKNKQ